MLTFQVIRCERVAFPGLPATVASDPGDLAGDVFVRVPETGVERLTPRDDALLPYLAFLALARGGSAPCGGVGGRARSHLA